MARFDWRELRRGRGDHWIAGGALAICALAAAQLALAQVALAGPDVLRRALADGSAALWGATICWVPILIAGEALHRRLAYDVRRWSTVFPLGMVAVCSFKTAAAVHAEAIRSFALAWTWVALAGWAAVAAGSLGRLLAAARRPEGAAREQI
jgi:tellurite resistance protein TehA-like permease